MDGLTSELETLRQRIEVARGSAADREQELILADLETAHEELRVADEEVRAQQAEVDRLVEAQRLGLWQHDRLIAAVPAAIFVSDQAGRIHAVNAAGAALLRVSVNQVVRKPIQTFVDYTDRAELRRLLSVAVRDHSDFQATVTLLPRDGAPLPVQLVVAVDANPFTGRIDVTWLVVAPVPGARTVGGRGPTASVRALVELTMLPLHSEDDDRETLSRVAAICVKALAPSAEVTVTVGEPAAPTVLASTGELAQHLDGAQMLSGEGPCQEAWRTGATVTSENITADPRWPALADQLTDLEPRGVLAVPVLIGDDTIGVLNVYLVGAGEPDAGTVADANLLGAAVGAVLHEIESKQALQTLGKQLRQAMESRAPIEQAKGLIMATRGCTADEAFAILSRMSNRAHLKVRDLAVRMVDQATRRAH